MGQGGRLKPLKAAIRQIIRKLKHWLPLDPLGLARFDLLRILVRRDLEERYKGSVLGNLWPLLNQLSQLLIFTFVFSVVLGIRLEGAKLPGNSSLEFGLWLFAGLLPWTAFTGGLSQAASSVVRQPNLVKKVVFPLSLLPLVPILSTFIESAFGMAVLIVSVALLFQKLPVTLALLPLIWLPQLLFTAGLGYLAAGLTVFLRDIPQALAVILNLWFYLTPIVYPVDKLEKIDIVGLPNLKDLVLLFNPLATIAEIYRDIAISGHITHWTEWCVVLVASSLVFLGGFWVYRRLRPAFADVL